MVFQYGNKICYVQYQLIFKKEILCKHLEISHWFQVKSANLELSGKTTASIAQLWALLRLTLSCSHAYRPPQHSELKSSCCCFALTRIPTQFLQLPQLRQLLGRVLRGGQHSRLTCLLTQPQAILVARGSYGCHPDAHAYVFTLIGLQSPRVAGEPVDDVPGDDIPRAAGKGWVGRTGVFQLLPLASSVYRPIQSEISPPKIRPIQILVGNPIKHSFQVYVTVVVCLQQ